MSFPEALSCSSDAFDISKRLRRPHSILYERTVAAEFGHVPVLQYMQQHHPDEFHLAELVVIARRNSNHEAEMWLNEFDREFKRVVVIG